MNSQETKAVKEVLFDYNAETIEFADEIADRILRKLNELSKPSERPNIKDFFPTDAQISDVHDEITAAPRLYAYTQALDAYIDNLEAKPSEPKTGSHNKVINVDINMDVVILTNQQGDTFEFPNNEYHEGLVDFLISDDVPSEPESY